MKHHHQEPKILKEMYYTEMTHIHPYCSEIANKKVERIADVTVGRGSARINFGCQLTVDPRAAQSDVILAGGRYEMPTVSAPTRI